MSNQQLIIKVIAREPAATREFVTRFGPIMQSGAARALAKSGNQGSGRQADIEEAVQGVFLHLCEDDFAVLKKYDEALGSLGAFLWKVAYNKTLKSIHRSGSGWRELPTDHAEGSLLHQPDSGGFAATEQRNELQVLWQELERELDHTDKDLLQLRFLDELPTELVCAELRITPQVMYQRVLRLKRLIRELADKLGIRPGK